MRPNTNAEIARALKDQSHYAQDSETKWLMEEAARRIGELDTVSFALDKAVLDEAHRATAKPLMPPKPQRLPRRKAEG